MMNRVVVCKFIPKDVPAMPSSSGTRSAPSTPSDFPPEVTPCSVTPPPLSSYIEACPQETPVIGWSLLLKNRRLFRLHRRTQPLSPLPPPVEGLPSAHKRPRTSKVGIEDTPSVVGEESELDFLAPVLTPRLDPQAGVSNMSKVVHRADVDVLAPRTLQGIGNFVLAQTSIIPAAITAMVEKYSHSLRNFEIERGAKLREELEALKGQVVEKDSQIALLSMENDVVRASTMQAYTRGKEEGVFSLVTTYKDSPEYATEIYHQASAFYIDGFATCLAQFKNIGNLSPGFDLSFVNVRVDGFGRTGSGGPSRG
ncbi:hypothetical protein Salat_1634800 [Sesamum alatum]|uniref:Uncharacterized protein n=1 Tax=Sesamum alatum TaxID=300844 RepID=A0AAE2CJN6_9LAMI|nr:hypothetical protein Salat_1634800 [Sesamum alatum]